MTVAHVGDTDVHGMVGLLTDARVDRLNDYLFCKFDWFTQFWRRINILTA